MRRISFFLSLLLLICFNGQVKSQAVFIIDSVPDYTPGEDFIYMAGDFNGWNPGDVNHKMTKNDDGLWEAVIDGFPDGITINYKFTRGNWANVEKGPAGEEIDNRAFTFGNGDTVHVIIYNWADFGGGGNSTAADNVTIIDEDFYIAQLERTRRIWLYLPPDYEASNAFYPVLYMHDGQNLFDEITSFAGEWEVDETLNNLAQQGYQVPIVVGIDNGGTYRIDELTPWYNEEYDAGGQGDQYLDFIVETLKPYVDEHYRTLPEREHTGIMGSSLGGLISCYGALKYQRVFSKSGVFSPAYWINNDSIWHFVHQSGYSDEIWFYQNIGENEGAMNILMMQTMEDSLRQIGYESVASKIIDNGEHNEQTWRDDFGNAYLWLFASYANDISEQQSIKRLDFYPNPVNSGIILYNLKLKPEDTIRFFNMRGDLVQEHTGMSGFRLEMSNLKSGSYIFNVQTADTFYTAKLVKL